jgi:hypothetical protein
LLSPDRDLFKLLSAIGHTGSWQRRAWGETMRRRKKTGVIAVVAGAATAVFGAAVLFSIPCGPALGPAG